MTAELTDEQRLVWVTRNKREMLIGEMGDDHLHHALKMMRRSLPWRSHMMGPIAHELKARCRLGHPDCKADPELSRACRADFIVNERPDPRPVNLADMQLEMLIAETIEEASATRSTNGLPRARAMPSIASTTSTTCSGSSRKPTHWPLS